MVIRVRTIGDNLSKNEAQFGIKGMTSVILVVGLLLFLAIYFFPLGNDVAIFWIMENWAGGDYWVAQRIMYIICALLFISAIIIGTAFGMKFMWAKGALSDSPIKISDKGYKK